MNSVSKLELQMPCFSRRSHFKVLCSFSWILSVAKFIQVNIWNIAPSDSCDRAGRCWHLETSRPKVWSAYCLLTAILTFSQATFLSGRMFLQVACKSVSYTLVWHFGNTWGSCCLLRYVVMYILAAFLVPLILVSSAQVPNQGIKRVFLLRFNFPGMLWQQKTKFMLRRNASQKTM